MEVSIGRHLATAFVVPLPIACTSRVWNMTQCVNGATQRAIVREAWVAAVAIAAAGPHRAATAFPDFVAELRMLRSGPLAGKPCRDMVARPRHRTVCPGGPCT
jgi:hypothetical protein